MSEQSSSRSLAPWGGLMLLVMLLGGGTLEACSMADLRPDGLNVRGDEAQIKGRRLLQEVAEHYGAREWRSYQTLEVQMVDRWPSFWVQSLLGWWPQGTQSLVLQTNNGQFSSRVLLRDGEWKGQRIGLHQGQSWRQTEPDGPLEWEQNKIATFYLPSLQYFNELPFQLAQADVTLYAGSKELRGKSYHLVLVSWQHAQPHEEHDQYLLWINTQTMQIEMCTYTVREAFNSATGTIHYSDFRRVQGVLLPFRQRVVLDPPEALPNPTPDDIFHEAVISEAAFDTFPASVLHLTP